MLDIGNRNQRSAKAESFRDESREVSQEEASLKMPSLNEFQGFNTTKTVAYFSLIITLLFVASFGYLFFIKSLRTSQLTTAQAKLNQLNSEMKSSGLTDIEEESIRFKNGFTEINTFLSKNFSWLTFFNELEKLLAKNCRIVNLTIGSNDAVNIKGEADSYESVAKLIASLKDSGKFTDVKLTSINKIGGDGTAEKITFEINPKINRSSFKEEK